MANLTLASAVVPNEFNGVLLTIGSTTSVTDPLQTTDGSAFVRGITALVTPVQSPYATTTPTAILANIPPIPTSNISGNVITIPFNTPIPALSTVVVQVGGAGTCNLEDSAGTPLLLTAQTVTATYPAIPSPYTALNAQVQAMLTADPLIALLQAGTFGKVVPLPGGWYRIYAAGNLVPLVEIQASVNSQGVLTQLKAMQLPSRDSAKSAASPAFDIVNPYPYQ